MTSTTNNFYKSGNKTKFPNMYAYDAFKTNNGIDSTKGKTSMSPTRIFSLKDFSKTTKNSTYLPLMNSYNNHPYKLMDNDKLQEELINYKNEINKKNKEFHNLKIAFMKLDEENKKNVKIIEEIIIEAGRGRSEIAKMSPDELDSEIKNIMAYTHPSDKMILKLKESYIINNLKRQLYEYKLSIEAKDEEIASLKNNGRVMKFHDLEAKMKATIDELITVKNSYSILLNSYNDKEMKLKELLDERDHLKSMNQKYKNQFDELKEKIQNFQDLNLKLTEQLRNLDDKNINSRFQQSAMKNQITDRDKMILSLQEELRGLEKFRLEKEKTEKLISNLTNSVNSLKEDLERKTKKLRELERVNLEMRMPNSDPSEKSGNRNTVSENSLDKLRDKVIRTLEIENRKMKDKLKKMNYENYKKIENNIENDIGKNVPTYHENPTQTNHNEKNENNNEEEAMNTPNALNASADNLNKNANKLNKSNLVNMGIDQEEQIYNNDNNIHQSFKDQDGGEIGRENENDSRGGENKSQKSWRSKSKKDEEDKIINKSNLEIENNENNENQIKQNPIEFANNDNDQNHSKINISHHMQRNSENENNVNDKSHMENLQKDSNHDNIENIERIDKNNTFERGDETIKKDVQDILENLDENMKKIDNPEEANKKEENLEHAENNEPQNNEIICVDENPVLTANKHQQEENPDQVIDNNFNKSAVLNEELNKIVSDNAEQDENHVESPNKSKMDQERLESEDNKGFVKRESSQKIQNAEEMVEEQPGYIEN